MINRKYDVAVYSSTEVAVRNNVLKNTYLLLSLTLLFSALMAAVSLYTNARHPGIIFFLVGTYGLIFLIHALRNSALGILAVFAFTGFLGYTLGPLLNMYMHLYSNASSIITVSLGATGVIFLALSAHVLTTRKDYSYLAGFLFAGVTIAMLAVIAGLFFNIPAFHLAISGAFALIASGMILLETSRIVNGGETNYILATVSLYVSIYNLFVSLLHILTAFAGNRD